MVICWTGLNQSTVSLAVAHRTPTFRDSLQTRFLSSLQKASSEELRKVWGLGAGVMGKSVRESLRTSVQEDTIVNFKISLGLALALF